MPEPFDVRPRPPVGLSITRGDGAVVCSQLWRAPERSGPRPPPIFVLDGIGCSGWGFRRIIPIWARERDVVLMHYRGHGHSPNPPRPWKLGMETLAGDALAVAEQLRLPPAIFVGFSMGFVVAIDLVGRAPEAVAGLVSIAGPSGRVLENFQGSQVLGHVLPLALASTRLAGGLARRLWRAWTPSEFSRALGLGSGQLNLARIETSDFDIYMEQLAATHPELFLSMLELAHEYDGRDTLAGITVPTLVLAGAADSFVPLSGLRQVAAAVRDAELQIFPDATHALPAEYPREIAQRVLRFATTRCDRARRHDEAPVPTPASGSSDEEPR